MLLYNVTMNKIEHIRKNTLIITVAALLSILSVTALTQAVEVSTVCLEPSPSCVNGTVTVPAQEVQANHGVQTESVNITPIPQPDSPVAPVEQGEPSASGC